MKEKISQLATIFSSFTMAACCLGPLILIPLGLTGLAGALAIYSLKYRLMLIVLTLVLLIYSFFMVYAKKGRKISSVISLWITTILVFGMFIFMFKVEGYL